MHAICALPGSRALVAVGLASLLVASSCGEPESRDEPRPKPAPRPAPRPPPPRALWVLCEGSQRVLENADRIPQLVEEAARLGATDLFVQVYRGGRAWFASSLADASPYRSLRREVGFDTLAELLTRAHAAGLRVHAWVNVLSLAQHRDALLVSELGRDAVLVDQRGRSLLDYPGLDVPKPDRTYYRMGTPGVYLDPAAPGVGERLVQIFGELLRRYPELDGLHLDYIRYPDVLPFAPGSRFGVGLDFGYGEATRARFREETGLEAPFGDSLANANRWDAWRRDKVTELVRAIGVEVRKAAPDVVLSAAVWAYANRAYLVLGQDWRGWLDADLLDIAVPMAYTLDDRLLGYLVEEYRAAGRRDRIWVGLGTWLFASDPARAVAQIEMARGRDAAGVALFSYDSIVDAPPLGDALEAAGRRPDR